MIELTLPQTTHQSLLSRRGLLRASIGGAGALAPSALFRGSAAANETRPSNKAVIQIWLGGGPSHIDLYDMKPAAPVECRGPFQPIATAQPGIDVCELLPLHAPIMRHLSVVRSLHHDSHDHVAGTHWMQTGSFGPTAVRLSLRILRRIDHREGPQCGVAYHVHVHRAWRSIFIPPVRRGTPWPRSIRCRSRCLFRATTRMLTSTCPLSNPSPA
jgi:hypothetical protein